MCSYINTHEFNILQVFFEAMILNNQTNLSIFDQSKTNDE
jgi:hypothetical protein